MTRDDWPRATLGDTVRTAAEPGGVRPAIQVALSEIPE
jgi:hypothetical protein